MGHERVWIFPVDECIRNSSEFPFTFSVYWPNFRPSIIPVESVEWYRGCSGSYLGLRWPWRGGVGGVVIRGGGGGGAKRLNAVSTPDAPTSDRCSQQAAPTNRNINTKPPPTTESTFSYGKKISKRTTANKSWRGENCRRRHIRTNVESLFSLCPDFINNRKG